MRLCEGLAEQEQEKWEYSRQGLKFLISSESKEPHEQPEDSAESPVHLGRVCRGPGAESEPARVRSKTMQSSANDAGFGFAWEGKGVLPGL